MEYKEFIAKTVDDAVINAKQELGLTSDEIEYEVIEKGSNGFLGIGAKPAKIKARRKVVEEKQPVVAKEPKKVEKAVKEEVKKEAEVSKSKVKAEVETSKAKAKEEVEASKAEVKEEKKIEEIDVTEYFEKAEKFLTEVAAKMGENVTVKASKGEDINSIDINMEGDNMGIFIGKRGQTLDALQYLTSIIVNGDSKSYIRIKLDTEDYRQRRKATLENLAFNMARRAVKSNRRVALEPMNPYERRIIHSALQENSKVDTFSEGVEPYRKVVIIPNK